jgi:hypothetical protein
MINLLGGLQWNTEVNLGNIVTWMVLLLGFIVSWVRMGDRIKVHDKWIEAHEKSAAAREQLGQTLNTNVQLLAQAMTALSQRLDTVERREPWDGDDRRSKERKGGKGGD